MNYDRYLYKCRLCKKIYEGDIDCADIFIFSDDEPFRLKGKDFVNVGVDRYNLHQCYNGNIGMSDFAGLQQENQKPLGKK